ncbi:MAG: hypothetical protein OHK93_002808 [Ramalina farinacea]|uniref:Uncharacterized protein n=1 Tax=Ramalina farinacea TaxID=258253 RepID=A0AA43QU36_9LECA|nr:hypothetical protein [Ramalina farinacea]
MSRIGQFSAGLLSAANENILALSNFKFDFSLVKVDAPREYSELGQALSTGRRNEAEDGSHHKTARRLGSLFEQIVPSTPHLIKAYGLRSSEIAKSSFVNPKGSARDGPFENYVGVDGTAMWAAATSGVPAIAVYLLACMLARAWDAREAVSIWVELVEQRRKDIMSADVNHDVVSESSRMSVSHGIERQDLARLDASARSWLESADQAKLLQQTQLMLVVKNTLVPFVGGSTTYSQVTEIWRSAMTGLDQLLAGKPQEISNRAILLAYSAWHLYPDFIILGNKITNVKFNDPCVHAHGVATLSSEYRPQNAAHGMTWSLALSHLRHYGDPVVVQSVLDFSRVTIRQLHLVALGSLYHHWGVSQRDIESVSHWFSNLWSHVQEAQVGAKGQPATEELFWLQCFAEAADKILASDGATQKEALQLVAYGQRRGKRFLGETSQVLTPFFGLCNPCILAGLSNPCLLAGLSEKDDEDRGLSCLRKYAMESHLTSSQAFIVFHSTETVGDETLHILEYSTAISHICATRKRDSEGNRMKRSLHARWLNVWFEGERASSDIELVDRKLQDRLNYIRARGELGFIFSQSPTTDNQSAWNWPRPPLLFDYKGNPRMSSDLDSTKECYQCPSLLNSEAVCRCFENDPSTPSLQLESTGYGRLAKIGNYDLCIMDGTASASSIQYMVTSIENVRPLPPAASSDITTVAISPDVLKSYLLYSTCTSMHIIRTRNHGSFADLPCCSGAGASDSNKTYIRQLASVSLNCSRRLIALRALALATRIYLQLDGARISLKIIDCPLDEALWLGVHSDPNIQNTATHYQELMSPLPQSYQLSCIVHFESGASSLEPEVFEEILAIASGNSIFVVGTLLSDPIDVSGRFSVKRITGNIGRPGICLLVSPVNPRIRSLGNEYNLVSHAVYDGKREDNFQSTSLHLSFTSTPWTLPLEARGARDGFIDHNIYLLESIISVRDSGKWVADIDPLCINFETLTTLELDSECPGHSVKGPEYDYTSIDSWEELLDEPPNVGFFRAHGNWAARLAAVSIMFQKEQGYAVGLLGPERSCFTCLAIQFEGSNEALAFLKAINPSNAIRQ